MRLATRRHGARASDPEGRGAAPKQYPWVLGVSMATAVCIVYLIRTAFGWSSIADRGLYANIAMISIGVAATVVAGTVVSDQTDTRSRWAWRLMGAAFACFCAGDKLFFVYQHVLGRSPFPSLADAGYLVYYPLLLAGLLCLPRERERRRRMGVRAAGCALLFLGGGAAVIEFLLLPSLGSADGDRFAYALSVGYPVGDILLLMGVVWTLFRSVAGRRTMVFLLTAGVGAGLLANIVYGYQSTNGMSQSGGVSDALFMCSWIFYAWAAYAEATRRQFSLDPVAPAGAVPAVAPEETDRSLDTGGGI